MTALNGPIRPKRSTVAGEAPQASDLVLGEVAVNTADGKLFTKHVDGSIKEISGSGGGGAVDSVNGETGVVSLGIQDMDDFELYQEGASLQWDTRSNSALDGPNVYEVHPSVNYIYVNNTSSTGEDQSSKLDLLDNATAVFTIGNTSVLANTGPVDERNGALRAFALDQNISALRAEDQSLPLTITYAPWGEAFIPLTGGDILQWAEGEQKFKPAALASVATSGDYNDLINAPSAGDAPVASVNGETGAVSLGIQDMNDYELQVVSGSYYGLTTEVSSYTQVENPDDYYIGASSLFSMPGDWNDSITAGDTLTIQRADQTTEFTYTIDQIITNANSKGAIRYLFIEEVDPSLNMLESEYSSGIIISSTSIGANTKPLAEGDILQWDNAEQKFKPAQLSAGGGGAVDSVNGETGDVSLGIQDMDDFQLNPAPALTYGSWATVTLSDSADYFYSGNAVIFGGGGGASCRVNHTDSDGKDFEAISAEAGQIDGYGELENFTFYASRDGGVSWTTHVATSAILDYGGAATAFDGISPELDATTDELRVSYDDPSLPPVPLAEGDILQWSSAYDEFRPAQLPADAPVDSVNGETGIVSLGVQDMNDFYTAPILVQTVRLVIKNSGAGQGECAWLTSSGDPGIRFGGTEDADGVNLQDYFATFEDGSTMWYSIDGGSTYSTTVASFKDYNGGTRNMIISSTLQGVAYNNNGSSLYLSVADPTGEVPNKLVDGTVLVWNDFIQKFKPTQLATVTTTGSYNDLTDQPAIPGEAPVDSVNGETGAVSLGVQDMNDFYTAPPLVETVRLVVNNFGAGQGECQRFSRSGDGNGLWFGGTEDADGVDLQDYFAAFEDGSTIWYSTNGGSTYNTTTADFFDYNGGTRNVLIADALYYAIASSNGITIYLSVADPTGEVPNKLVDGTVLVWNDFIQKFKPTQLATVTTTGSYNDLTDQPAIPGEAPVDSVNGETGAVSLGIQDMNDFSLLADDGLDVGTYDTYVNTVSNLHSTPGGTSINVGSDTFPLGYAANFGQLGADGVDRRASFETLDNGPVWVSINGLPFVPTTGQWTNDFNGYLRVIIDGTGAAPDGTVMNEVRITAVEPGTPQPLEDGDCLRWNANSELFLPAQLATVASTGSYNDLTDQPTIPGDAPVDSVNGEIGAVSLGIQDMDDFRAEKSLFFDEYRTSWTGATSGAYRIDDSDPLAIRFATRINSVPVNDEMTGLSGSDIFLAFGSTVIGPMTATITQTNTAYTLLTSPSLTSEIIAEIEAWGLGGGGIYFISSALTSSEAENFISDGDILRWDGVDQKFKPAQVADAIPADLQVNSLAATTAIGAASVVGTNVIASNSSQAPTVVLYGEQGLVQASFLTDGTNSKSMTDVLAAQDVLKAVVAASTDFADFQARIAAL